MTQQVNLYETKPETGFWKEYYPWPQLGACLVGLLMVTSLYLAWEKVSLGKQLLATQNQHQASRLQLEQLDQQMSGQGMEAYLESKIAELKNDLREKQVMLGTIGSEEAGKYSGFSSHLLGLARHPVEGLWLTRIELFDGGKRVGLEGLASKPEFVPLLIKSIGSEVAFSGAEFDIFQLKQEGSLLGFTVGSARGNQ